jgi:hypothetical protein
MPKGFGGTDFLYIGLAAGALYAIYRLMTPVTKAAEAASGVVQSAGQAASGIIPSIFNVLGGTPTTSGYIPTVAAGAQTAAANIGGVLGAVSTVGTTIAKGPFTPGGVAGAVIGVPSYNTIISSATNWAKSITQPTIPTVRTPILNTLLNAAPLLTNNLITPQSISKSAMATIFGTTPTPATTILSSRTTPTTSYINGVKVVSQGIGVINAGSNAANLALFQR